MIKSHLLVEYTKLLPATDFTRRIVDLVENSVKFDLGEIDNFDSLSSISKEDEFVNTPFEQCLFQISVRDIGHTYIVLTEESEDKKTVMMYFAGIIGAESNHKWFAPDVTIRMEKSESGDLLGIMAFDEYGNEKTADNTHEDEHWWIFLAQSMCRIFPVLACSNVMLSDNLPPKLINKKRAKKGKCQIHEYKTLNIKIPNYSTKKQSPASSEKRESPRLHLRRGHIRVLPSGNRVWVASCIVGNEDTGTIEKDYSISGYPTDS